MSNIRYPQDFIQDILINEIGALTKTNAYLSFVLIATGIEFLGRCIDDSVKWDARGLSSQLFNTSIDTLMPKYRSHNLYILLRCGLSHYLSPQKGLDISEAKHGKVHLSTDSKGNLILNIEDFYNDFKSACEQVIQNKNNKLYTLAGKMYQPFLEVE